LIPLRDINPTSIFPLLTIAIIAVNVAVFLFVQPFDNDLETEEFFYETAAIACELTTGDPLEAAEIQDDVCFEEQGQQAVFPDKNVWVAALVSMFLHGGLLHIGFNMWSLWIFGNNVEEAFGVAGYAALYLVAGVAATAGFVVANQDSTVPLVGASGAIAGIMGAYLVLFPRHRVLTLILPFFIVTIPALAFLGIWFVLQFGLAGQDSNVAWEAHVAGFAAGALIALLLRPVLLRRTSEVREAAARPF
jgi:membrane associated rhomboid family serine protease